MSDVNTLRIHLLNLVDGKEIEKFVMERRLRSGGDRVYEGGSTAGDFIPGIRYGLIVAESTDPVIAQRTAEELARKFDGIVS